MTYDRRSIMTEAWAIARRFAGNSETWAQRLSRALRNVWSRVKDEARIAAAMKAEMDALAARSVASLAAEIAALEQRTFLGHDRLSRQGRLRQALRIAEAREAAEAQAAKRALIASAEGRYCVVTFTKADGSERVMRLQPAALRLHVKGEAASDAARKAVATRAQRHPHLMPVWDADKRAPRSVNLATVSRIAVNGAVHEFRAT